MTDPNCIFCKIVSKAIPAEIIYEDNDLISFLDINPVNHGHLLVIPKDHHPLLTETPDELLTKVFLRAKSLMKSLKEATDSDFVVLTVVGTDVPHFHVHLIPRFYEDGLAGFWPAKKYESEKQMKSVAEKIRKTI
ncbi:HIT family protein [Candidatus Parcubacteria bacterium]|nr:HIT family protein [Candidatus Parcubacteria bacterium]